MAEIFYWTTRIGLAIAWLAVAWRMWRRRLEWPRFGPGAAIVAVLFASMRAWPWNYWLLETARAGLVRIGVYDIRIWFKLILAAALLVAIVFAVRRMSRWAPSRSALGCCIGLGAQALLLAIETLSLDDVLPQCLQQQPGRYLTEGACVTLTLVSLAWIDKGDRADMP